MNLTRLVGTLLGEGWQFEEPAQVAYSGNEACIRTNKGLKVGYIARKGTEPNKNYFALYVETSRR